jgi:hypothetical protein
MSGDRRTRYCSACQNTVYNLAEMSRREVDRLSLRAALGERVCARITWRANGELVTLEPRPLGRATGVLLSAAIAWGASAVAQELKPEGQAVLTGRVSMRSTPAAMRLGARSIQLVGSDGKIVVGKVVEDGTFSVIAPPGVYDVVIRSNIMYGARVKAATLHEGYQSLGEVPVVQEGGAMEAGTTMGAMASTIVGPRYWVRHPLAYARYVGHRMKSSFSE